MMLAANYGPEMSCVIDYEDALKLIMSTISTCIPTHRYYVPRHAALRLTSVPLYRKPTKVQVPIKTCQCRTGLSPEPGLCSGG